MHTRPALTILSIVGALLLLPSTVVHGQVTKAEAKCRKTIAKETAKYVKLAQKNIVKCHKLFDKGKQSGDNSICNDPNASDSNGKLARQASKLRDKVGGAKDQCSDALGPLTSVLATYDRCRAPAETVDDGGATDGIDTFSEVADCLIAQADHWVETTAREILSVPTLPLNAEHVKCHAALAKRYTKLVDAIVKGRAKCQIDADKQGGPIGFACTGADPGGKIAKARQKLTDDIPKACAQAVGGPRARAAGTENRILGLGSCSEDANGLITCVIGLVEDVGGGLGAMAWDWSDGTCPTAGDFTLLPVVTDTELDVGWTGATHDLAPMIGHKGAEFDMSCDADCTNCTTRAWPPRQSCRCSDDATSVCVMDTDCAGTCQCFFGPPAPTVGANTSVCVVNVVDGTMTGEVKPLAGELSLEVPLRVKIYLGEYLTQPCPTCDGGVCSGGDRAGLACTVDATDPTFGDVSYDCPPYFAYNVSGVGTRTAYRYSTGTASLPFGTTCDFSLDKCACALCSNVPERVCNTNADCPIGWGTCTASFPSVPRFANACYDTTCSPDVNEPTEGECLAGPIDHFCDGFVYPSGEGILRCVDNSDCSPGLLGFDAGNCTLQKNRECFLDPIEAEGIPGKKVVGIGCFGGTGNSAMSAASGWPGAYRIQQHLSLDLLCSDGVTPFEPPGGLNCP